MSLAYIESSQGKKVVSMKKLLCEPVAMSGFIVGGVELPEYLGLKVFGLSFLPNNLPPCDSG